MADIVILWTFITPAGPSSGDAITELAKNDERIWLLTPDIGWGCNDFKKAHPERFIDAGIAEQCVRRRGGRPGGGGQHPGHHGHAAVPVHALPASRCGLTACYPEPAGAHHRAPCGGLTGGGGSTHYAMEDMALILKSVGQHDGPAPPADPNHAPADHPQQLSMDSAGPMAIRLDAGQEGSSAVRSPARCEVRDRRQAHTARRRQGRYRIIATRRDGRRGPRGRGCALAKEGIRRARGGHVLGQAASTRKRSARLLRWRPDDIVAWEDHLMSGGLAASAVSDCR